MIDIKDNILELDYLLETVENIQEEADRIQKLRAELNTILTDEENYKITNAIKNKIQAEIDFALDINNNSGLVVGATGIGKSKVGVERANKVISDRVSTNIIPTILLVVPTEKLRDEGWKNEFNKWGVNNSWSYIERTCYASLNNFKLTDWDLIILDECHNITELNSEFFFSRGNSWDRILAMTATEPKNLIKINILKRLNLNIVYEISLDTAVKLGIVSPYSVVCVGVELDKNDKYILAGSKKKPFMTTEWNQYQYLTKLVLTAPNKFNTLKRMHFIYNLKSKTEAARNILKYLVPEDSRVLVFCASIKQAESLSTNVFHSRTDDTFLNLFNEEKIHRLYCIDALNEGQNLTKPDLEIMLKIIRDDRQLVQRAGRHIRYRPGHKGLIIIIYAMNTVEEEWMKSATRVVDPSNISYIEYNKLRKGEQQINF